MSLSEYFEQHEELAFVAKALASAVAITLVKSFFPGLVAFLFLVFPVIFLFGLRMHAATSGVSAMDLLRENITFFPVMRSEAEWRKDAKPWVTYGIILANIVIFYGFETSADPALLNEMIFLPMHPDAVSVTLSAFTSLFLHAGNGHLWGNMTFLWVVGSAVERRVGRTRFFFLYLITGLLGGLAYVTVEYLFHGRAGHALGASGAIAGIMGIFAIRCYFKTMIFPVPILGIFSLILPISLKIRLNSLLIMALFFISDLSGGIEQIAGESASMVGHWAHLGGMISGMLIAGYLKLGEAAVEERHLEIGIKASQASQGFQGGQRSMQIALDRNPDNVDAVLGMARLKTKFHPGEEGRELYEKSLTLLLDQRPDEVLDVLVEYKGKYLQVPREPKLLARLVEATRKAGATDLLIECLERMMELPETTAQQREKTLFQLATLYEFTSCFEAARGAFARFVYEYPGSLLADKAREKAGGEVYAPRPQSVAPQRKLAAPICQACGREMTVRIPNSGAKKGVKFWVCGAYPVCQTFHPVEPAATATAAVTPPASPAPPPRYRLVLEGSIGFCFDPAETKEKLAQLLRCRPDQADRLCNGTPTVLKRGMDHETALRYRDAVADTGALCKIEPEAAPAPPPSPAPAAALPAVPPATAATAAPATAAPVSKTAAAAPFNCPKCGQAQDKGDCCIACGIYFDKLARIAERDFHSFQDHLAGSAQKPAMLEHHERRWAMLCHLLVFSGLLIPLGNLLGPFIVWSWKRKHSAFVDYHGKTVLNFQITLLLFAFGIGVLGALTGFMIAFLAPLLGILGIYSIWVIVSGAIKSHRGDVLEIPISAEFIK